jgi:hypothetical protein
MKTTDEHLKITECSTNSGTSTNLDETGKAEISNFDQVILANEDVPGGQITVNVILRLQVSHTGRNLRAHVDQVRELQDLLVVLEVLQHRAVGHELGDDVDRLLGGAHGVQLDQVLVTEPLHDLGLDEEVLRVHRAGFEGLDRHFGGVLPQAFVNLAEVALSEATDEAERSPVDFPLVGCFMGQARDPRSVDLSKENSSYS